MEHKTVPQIFHLEELVFWFILARNSPSLSCHTYHKFHSLNLGKVWYLDIWVFFRLPKNWFGNQSQKSSIFWWLYLNMHINNGEQNGMQLRRRQQGSFPGVCSLGTEVSFWFRYATPHNEGYSPFLQKLYCWWDCGNSCRASLPSDNRSCDWGESLLRDAFSTCEMKS